MSESTVLNPRIYFEPGVHSADVSVQKRQYNQTMDGAVSVHVWNKAICERLLSYKPGIIAVDSMLPSGIDDASTVDFADKASIWTLMPGRPSQINGQNEILVLAGDNLYGEPGADGFIDTEIRSLNGLMLILGSIAVGRKIAQRFPPKRPYEEQSSFYDLEAEDKKLNRRQQRSISRRAFLAEIVAGGLSLGVISSSSWGAYSPWQFPEGVAIDLDTAVESISLQRIIDKDYIYEYLEGRSALLISKLHDVMSHYLPEGAGAVVMGDAHTFQANDLIADPELRDEHIRRHTEIMLEIAKRSKASFTGRWSPRQRERWVLDNEKKLQIFRVLEPDAERFKAEPQREIDRIVRLEKTMTSPSVAAAIAGLAQS